MKADAGAEAMLGRLRKALTAARKSGDAAATAALRSALATIDNAGAVPDAVAPKPPGTSAIAGAVIGLGSGDVPRRELGASAVRGLLQIEVDERLKAADEYEALGRPDRAERLRVEAAVLLGFLGPA